MLTIQPRAVDATAHWVLPDGTDVIVPRVLTPVAGGLFFCPESVPPGVYGAPIGLGDAPAAQDLRAVGGLFRGVRMAAGALVEVPGRALDLGLQRETMTTHILSLEGAVCEDDLLRRYRKGHRSDVRSARRAGVEVSRASTPDDITRYHELYLETVKRWSRAPAYLYPVDFFLCLHELAATLDTVRILVAHRGEEVLAGVVVLIHGSHAAYWHAASSEAGQALHAGHLAVHEAIKDALARGARSFDFMPNPGLDPVARYKTGFGAKPVLVGVHRHGGSLPYRAALRVRRALGGDG